MRTTIDAAGRVVIPKQIRQAAGLQPGTVLEVHLRGGWIEIEAAPLPVTLVRRGRLLVAVPSPEADVPEMTLDTVELTREALRRERAPDPMDGHADLRG